MKKQERNRKRAKSQMRQMFVFLRNTTFAPFLIESLRLIFPFFAFFAFSLSFVFPEKALDDSLAAAPPPSLFTFAANLMKRVMRSAASSLSSALACNRCVGGWKQGFTGMNICLYACMYYF
jgi:hypothetical protein